MQCPRCSTEMSARTVVSPSDAHQLLTTHLCPACVKRVLVFAPNPRYVVPPSPESGRPPVRLTRRLEEFRGLE